MQFRQRCLAIMAPAIFIGLMFPFTGRTDTAGQVAPVDGPALPQSATDQGGGLQPGDVVSVTVVNEPQLSGTYYVQSDGSIEMPMIGAVAAAGRTLGQLTAQIIPRLERYVRNPRISIVKAGGVSRLVSILGSVHSPGSYDLRMHPRLLSLLAAAGGPTPEADLDRVVLIRSDEPALVAATAAEGTRRTMPRDVTLEPHDIVLVPSLIERSIRVLGAVARPGPVVLFEGITVSRAVLSAGGAADNANLQAVQLLRGSERLSIDLRPILQPDTVAADLQAGDAPVQIDDIIIVPQRQPLAVHVIGAVHNPGPQLSSHADRASKAIALAGGATEDADLSRAYILRESERICLDLRDLLRPDGAEATESGRDASTTPGDVVVVPILRPVFVLGAVHQPGSIMPDGARTVTQALFGAGGLTADADAAGAYVLRAGEQIGVDLRALLEEGDARADIGLRPEDALIVPSTPQIVNVVGEVHNPGAHPIIDAETLVDLWGLSGGALPAGNAGACVLLRGSQSEIVDMRALIEDGAVEHNRRLRAGDTLLVPRIPDQAYIFGAVVEPGIHPIHDGDTIIDLIARAGGPTSLADISKVALMRRAAPQAVSARPERMSQRAAAEGETGGRSTRWQDRRSSSGTTRTRPAVREDPSAGRTAQTIQEGERSISLFDLARVQVEEPAYLARPGDVIWIPPRDLRQSHFDGMLRDILIRAPFFLF